MAATITAPTFEKNVMDDFLLFMEYFQESFGTLTSDREKDICQKWLDKLTIETYSSIYDKQMRNIYLSQLVLCMKARRLSDPFDIPPKSGPLSLDGVFKEITAKPLAEMEKETKKNENDKKWEEFVRNRELEMPDLNQLSKDGRTYIALKTLPRDEGVFAYVAVAMGGDADCKWVNTCGQLVPPPVVTSLDLKVESPVAHKNIRDQEDKAYQIKAAVRSTLSKRKSPEVRQLTIEFFNRIYNSIEQEMLSEEDPNSTACHDPYVQKLLEKLLNDSKIPCDKTYNPRLFKRIKMLSLLKKRVKDILFDIKERTKQLSKIDEASVSPILNLTNPAPTCPNSMSEKMWQGALEEQPTSKMAETLAKTYPVCLVKMLLVLLTRERRKIINRLHEKHEKLVSSMKKDLKNVIERGLTSYKVARREWVDVMRIVMFYNSFKGTLTENKIDGKTNDSNGEYLQNTIRKEIEATKNRLQKAYRKNENLQDDICDLNKNVYELTEKIEIYRTQNDEQIRDLRNDICLENGAILERAQTIEELERMLKEWERQ